MSDEHDIPKISCQYLGEPLLCFADGKQHIDPKFGILNFGPKSYSPIRGRNSEADTSRKVADQTLTS
ncbi:MAG TPA: hypothetical protein VK211_10090 [Kamptonema sp.]|nr:hypothetical protein [Kamptonema sp.]